MTAWTDELVASLVRQPVCGYSPDGTAATEPTALAALALLAHGETSAAKPALDWLATQQAADGSLGINAQERAPNWPTALAILAWQAAHEQGDRHYAAPSQRGRNWLLGMRGKTLPRTKEMGHDSTLVGWPWVDGTHSWLEPTAWCVLALASVGEGNHPRTREGVQLIADRLLSGGGCNYGNTWVLGQELRPHVQPTGLALLALTRQPDRHGRIAASKRWLTSEIGPATPSASLAYALLGLAAHRAAPPAADQWLQAAFERLRPLQRCGLRLALLALAAAPVNFLTRVRSPS